MSELRRFTFNHRDADADFKNKLAKSAFEEFRNDFFDYSELNKLKSEVEWDVFWNIVEEVAIKSGIDPKDLNRVRPSTIVGVKDVKKSTQLGGGRCCWFL